MAAVVARIRKVFSPSDTGRRGETGRPRRLGNVGEAEASPFRPSQKGDLRVVHSGPSAILRLLTVVLSVRAVRPLGQALDLLAGERDPIEGLAVLFPLRLAQRTGGEDEIALDDVALDVAARRLTEDSDFIPAGAVDPFAAGCRGG